MACPFAAAATIGGAIVGSKLLLFRDRFRYWIWSGLLIAIFGWTIYTLHEQPPHWLRIILEIEATALILGMIARIVWIVRVERQSLDIPPWLKNFLKRLRPLVVHPVTLSLKALLLLAVILNGFGLYHMSFLQYGLLVGALIGWLFALSWRRHARQEKKYERAGAISQSKVVARR